MRNEERGVRNEEVPQFENAMRNEERGVRNEEVPPANSTSSFSIPRSSFLIAFSSNCAVLHALPISALRLSASTVALLELLGIERIGQLAELPRDQLAERFGPEVGLRLDQ